jgi:hypothetical protein
MAAAAVTFAGCRGDSGEEKRSRAEKRKKRRIAARRRAALRKVNLPRDVPENVAKLLGALESGDMVRSWRAEEALLDLGEEMAPYTRLMFGSTSPEARGAACRLAYAFKDTASISTMIDLLADESRLVRVEASVNLSGLTGQDFNFRPDALPADRDAAIGRWQTWYVKTYGTPHGRNNRRRR